MSRWVKSGIMAVILSGAMMNFSNSFAGSGRGDFHSVYKGQSVDDLVIQYMAENHIPGMALAIVQAPYITRMVGYGLADTESKRLVSTRTLFNVGQLANAFTAVAVMQLKEEGKLALDDSIAKYLPDLPESWRHVTLRQLLNHSSGLPDYTEASDFDYSKDYQPRELIRGVEKKEPSFKAGTRVQASATNYYLLGMLIEKVSGMSYQDFISKNQIERIGLKHTFFISNVDTVANEVNKDGKGFKHSQFLQNPLYINPTEQATGYEQKDRELVPAPSVTWGSTYANSGVVASAEDISLWDIALAGSILVKDPQDRAFLYNSTEVNGKVVPANAGWLFPGHKGLMEIKGNIPGYSAFLSRFTAPDELLCVTLLANKGNLPDLDILGRKIAGAFDIHLAAPEGASWSETIQSPYSVKETLDRVVNIIEGQGGKVFARIDHSGEAEKVNQSLPPTQVLVVGNPEKGTVLMQTNPAFALDLPLRIMATEDELGQVWLSFTDPVKLGKEYQVDDKQGKVLKQISTALKKVCQKAVSAQQGQ